jgi:hypothetical protein
MSKLLTSMESSPKLAKYTGDQFDGAILYLASAVYRPELCPNAGECLKSCLITNAGRGAIGGPDNAVQRARKRKSDWLLTDRAGFVAQLVREIRKIRDRAHAAGRTAVIRLNGGSDLDWTDVYTHPELTGVQYWEYTKRPELAVRLSKLPNVHVTYSYNERTTSRIMAAMLANSINVAMVFNIRKGNALPAQSGTIPVIDGDQHDFRFLDPKGVIVGLRLKSLRKVTDDKLAGGFVQLVSK